MKYPEKIILERGTPEFALLEKHSELFRIIVENYAENKDEVTLTPYLFGDDDNEWEMFVDVFFPELAIRPFFIFKNKKISINSKRGTKEELKQLLRYMLIDHENTMLNFVKSQAKKSINAPRNVSARSVRKPIQQIKTYTRSSKNNFNNYSNYYSNYNQYNDDSNNTGPRLGYTEENEKMLGKLRGKDVSKYFPNEGGKRKTRRTRNHRMY